MLNENQKIKVYSFLKKNYLILGSLWLIINLYLNRIIPAIEIIISLLIIYFKDHSRIKDFINNIHRNRNFLLYHYKTEFLLNSVYVFTRVNYIFAPFFFIFCQGVLFLSENSTGYAALIFFPFF